MNAQTLGITYGKLPNWAERPPCWGIHRAEGDQPHWGGEWVLKEPLQPAGGKQEVEWVQSLHLLYLLGSRFLPIMMVVIILVTLFFVTLACFCVCKRKRTQSRKWMVLEGCCCRIHQIQWDVPGRIASFPSGSVGICVYMVEGGQPVAARLLCWLPDVCSLILSVQIFLQVA